MADNGKTRVTAAEFLARPETNLPVQLLDGEVIEMAGLELGHQEVVDSAFVVFKQAAAVQGGKAYVAPVDVYFDDLNIVQSDVLWIAPDSRCKAVAGKRLSGEHDLIAEVLSPTTARDDRRVKFRLYEQHGVREYWIIDPRDRLIEVWQQHDGRFDLLDVYGRDETFVSALIGPIAANTLFAP